MKDRKLPFDGTMCPALGHYDSELIDSEPVEYAFLAQVVRGTRARRARRKANETRAARAFLKRLDQEKERREKERRP